MTQSSPSNIDGVDEILDRYAVDFLEIQNPGHTVDELDVKRTEAKQAIQSYIDKAVKEARIDELMRFDDWLRQYSGLDFRHYEPKKLRDHVWLRKSEVELTNSKERQ